MAVPNMNGKGPFVVTKENCEDFIGKTIILLEGLAPERLKKREQQNKDLVKEKTKDKDMKDSNNNKEKKLGKDGI